MVSGKKEMAEDARDALQALVPITKEMEIPFELLLASADSLS